MFITGVGFTIIPAAIASFHFKISSRAALASFISGTAYVMMLAVIAAFQDEPFEFFKDKADLAILSIVVSAVVMVIVNVIEKKKTYD